MLDFDADSLKTFGEAAGAAIAYAALGALAVFSAQFKHWLDARKARKAVVAHVAQSVVTQSFLTELRARVDCDRLTVSQFHNGEHFASGASVQKVTVTHVQLRAGISFPHGPEGQSLNATPATFIVGLLDELFKRGYCTMHDFEAADHWYTRYLAANGLKTTVVCLIPGAAKGEAYGILSYCWLDKTDITPALLADLTSAARQASAYL